MPAKRASTAADSAPPSKRAKASAPANAIKTQQGKQPVETAQQTDDSGDAFWELSSGSTRRVTVNQFKGSWQVNIREYYNRDGAMLPGKKGISMPVDQWAALVQALPQIEKVLKEAGQEVPRPRFDGGGASLGETEAKAPEEQEEEEEKEVIDEAGGNGEAEEQAEEEEEDTVDPPAHVAPQPAKTKQKPTKEKKRNYEATDDEEDEPVPAAGSGASKLAKFKYGTA